jgi:DNA-directed RNA polymerase subunit H (RpoH/RPB5)
MSIEIEIIRANIKDMLDARGDDVTYIEEHGDAVESTRYYNELITLDTDRTTVFFALTKEVLKEWKADKAHESEATMLEAYPGKTFMLVLADAPSPANLGKLVALDKSLQAAKSMLQIFYTKELMYNPLKHSLVPLHEKLPDAEARDMQEMYMIKHKSQMPVISHNDIIARWLALRTGDIVRITRYNDTSGTYYYYRCCV